MIHLTIGFGVAYELTGSLAIAGGIALVVPCLNAVAFFFHEKAWQRGRHPALFGRGAGPDPLAAGAPST